MRTDLNISFEALYDACLYSSIAHAVSNLKYPFSSYTQSWDDMNYSFQDGSSRGTITFDLPNMVLVGAIRNEKSDRIHLYPNFKAIELFDEASDVAKNLSSNEALEFLFDEIDGITAPVATTAFWNEGNQIVSCDSRDDFIENGGDFIYCLAVSMQQLKLYWGDQYELTPKEFECIDCLFQLKKEGKTKISMDSVPLINGAQSVTVNGERVEGDKEFIKSLIEIGFEIKKE
jgi:hypothetical protein